MLEGSCYCKEMRCSGVMLTIPALIAPFGGGEQLFHPDGHVATGRAAATCSDHCEPGNFDRRAIKRSLPLGHHNWMGASNIFRCLR
jgi:hypothetical protein